MKARQAKPNKVLLILRTTESGREILQGALQYARADPYCSVQMELRPDALTPEKVASFESAGYDGILTSEIGMSEEVNDISNLSGPSKVRTSAECFFASSAKPCLRRSDQGSPRYEATKP